MMMFLFYNFFLALISFFNNYIFFISGILLSLLFLIFNFSFCSYYSNISYFLGGDLLSLVLVILTIWICFLMYISSPLYFNNKYFLMVIFFLMIFLSFSFFSMNLFLFYVFFEASLIPTLILIFVWGYQPERLSSGFYLLFYTLFGSLPLLLGVFYLYNISNSSFFFFMKIDFNFYIYLGLILAFLIKMPMFFFHFWLPKAHVEAPISGSMILAGVLLKLGGYGLIRIMFLISGPCLYYNDYFIILSLFGMLMIGFLCLFQSDIKSLIAYSSVSHMALVICGIFTINYWGVCGSLVLMVGHGLCSSGLFCLANIIYERSNSRSFYINKGLITIIPSLSFFWFLFCANNMACPPSLNLLGEIMLINSIMSWCSYSFFFLMLGSFLSCCYSIYLYSYTQHGILYSGMKNFNSINYREFYLLILHWLPLNFVFLKPDLFTLLI
uniref:NADH dehydrogenase subunit 4 n=1 Tax=Hermatobates djiboutensis TaxID=301294 RepID=UPI002E7A659B|nr:NADH dehydrogenase subunit 4 [Hermatobates djiboutensis]WPW46692.1 NADH dehydrogenase subunit 4 [Hermatobates djiboutensis]